MIGTVIEIKTLGEFSYEESETVIFSEIKKALSIAERVQVNKILSAHLYWVKVRELHTIQDRWTLATHGFDRTDYPSNIVVIGDNYKLSPTIKTWNGQPATYLQIDQGFTVDKIAERTYQQNGVKFVEDLVAGLYKV